MTVGPASLIKAQIKANLDALVTAGVLGSVIEQDINTNILNTDFPSYPCAVLGISDMQAAWEYQQSNRRTYTFPLLIVQLQDNISSVDAEENLRDAIAIQFDNNVTLAGTAPLGVAAVVTDRAIYTDRGKNFVLFNVIIKATTIAYLTYNF